MIVNLPLHHLLRGMTMKAAITAAVAIAVTMVTPPLLTMKMMVDRLIIIIMEVISSFEIPKGA